MIAYGVPQARQPNNKASTMSHRFTLDALKELITARRDAEQGLRICAEHVRGERLRTLVLSHLQECVEALQELQSLVRLLHGREASPRPERRPWMAGEVDNPGSEASARMKRRWAELRATLACAALACTEDEVILDECERGESRALEVYRNALDDPLPGLVRAILLRQFEDVMTNHDQIRDLRSQWSPRVDPGASSGAQAGQY
jgi:uncharacterized protein (TIGR02284 family)